MCFLLRMGQLFSRAIKRFTSQSSPSQHEELRAESDRKARDTAVREQTPPVVAQSIKVGQSIDQEEYDSLKSNVGNSEPDGAKTGQDEARPDEDTNGSSKQDVEEAVIKIQALIRGHLTRKALRDANQAPANPNALGQSQFDADSLIKNPPAAVFLPSSPLSSQAGARLSVDPTRPTLEAIAEVPGQTIVGGHSRSPTSGRKLALHAQRSSPTKLEMPTRSDSQASSASPVPSETNASIDLNANSHCGTPASASIDILDHNIRPTDKIASVLHHRASDSGSGSAQAPRMVTIETTSTSEASWSPDIDGSASVIDTEEAKLNASQSINSDETLALSNRAQAGTPDSEFLSQHMSLVDSEEEQAAIRIQSAFRGYRTRKTSPYSKRSPHRQSNSLPSQPTSDSNLLTNGSGLQPTSDRLTADSLDDIEGAEQRSTRPKNRSLDPSADEAAIKLTADHGSDASNQSDHPTVIGSSDKAEEVRGDTRVDQQQANWSIELESPSSAALDEQASSALTAALESGPQTVANEEAGREAKRKQSDISIELDMTDSSLLGAALSFNDEPSLVADSGNQAEMGDTALASKSISELESEAQRLVSELDSLGESLRRESDRAEAGEHEPAQEQVDESIEQQRAQGLQKKRSSSSGSSVGRDESSGDEENAPEKRPTNEQQQQRKAGNRRNRNKRRGKK